MHESTPNLVSRTVAECLQMPDGKGTNNPREPQNCDTNMLRMRINRWTIDDKKRARMQETNLQKSATKSLLKKKTFCNY